VGVPDNTPEFESTNPDGNCELVEKAYGANHHLNVICSKYA